MPAPLPAPAEAPPVEAPPAAALAEVLPAQGSQNVIEVASQSDFGEDDSPDRSGAKGAANLVPVKQELPEEDNEERVARFNEASMDVLREQFESMIACKEEHEKQTGRLGKPV